MPTEETKEGLTTEEEVDEEELREKKQKEEDEAERLRLLAIRKKQELKIVKKYDKTKIYMEKECWFLMDTKWLNNWSAFVNDVQQEPPGPMSTAELLDSEGNAIKGLLAKIDYRAVPPIVYFIFLELYGKDSSPEICRYVIDIYKHPVPIDKLVKIRMHAATEASIKVNKIRQKWMKWDIYPDEEEEEMDLWCCGLTKEHIETFIYWAITCWASLARSSRKKSGRGNIKYRQYKPLRPLKDDEGQNETLPENSEGKSQESGDFMSSYGAGGIGGRNQHSHKIALPPGEKEDEKKKVTLGGKKGKLRGKRRKMAEDQQFKEWEKKLNTKMQRDEDSSDISTDEEIALMSVGPAEQNQEKGTWMFGQKWFTS